MSRRKSKAEVLVVQFVERDEQPLRPLANGRRAAIVESAGLPLLPLEEALAWAARFNRGEIRRPTGTWAVVRRVRVDEGSETGPFRPEQPRGARQLHEPD